MSPRTGRPTDNPKGVSIHVRLDKECDETLKEYCEQEKSQQNGSNPQRD